MIGWMRDAACKGMDPSLFFVEGPGETKNQAVAVCARCPVRRDCLDYAIENREYHGIWGGVGRDVRDRVRRDRRRGAA